MKTECGFFESAEFIRQFVISLSQHQPNHNIADNLLLALLGVNIQLHIYLLDTHGTKCHALSFSNQVCPEAQLSHEIIRLQLTRNKSFTVCRPFLK